jgi:hypothetical protein
MNCRFFSEPWRRPQNSKRLAPHDDYAELAIYV